jgi:replicative DNA helicase
MAPKEEQGLPASVQTEITVLGAMLLDAVAISDAISKLVPEDFALDSHQRIFRCMVEMMNARNPVDLVTVMNKLTKTRQLDAIGGAAYLAFLTEGIPRNPNVESYVEIVKDRSTRRRMMSITNEAMAAAADGAEETGEIIDQAVNNLRALKEEEATGEMVSAAHFFESLGEPEHMFDRIATPAGVNMGFPQLHEVTGGPQPGELWIVAARPSMGKSAWMANAAQFCSLAQIYTSVFTLEMPNLAILRRMLSSSSRVDYKKIREKTLDRHERTLILERRAILTEATLYLDDKPKPTLARLRDRLGRQQRKVGLDIAFVDQLSKVSRKGLPKGMPKHEQVGELTDGLKLMAQDLGIPIIVFNQLKRPENKRDIQAPTLSDLKESGNIEEDADVVVLLHRPEYYERNNEEVRGKGQMIVAKNREGETKTCHVLYDGRIMRWEDPGAAAVKQASLDSYYTDIPEPPTYGDRIDWSK